MVPSSAQMRGFTERDFPDHAVQQINGREGETATFLSRFSVKSNGLGSGFAPRHLNRYVASLKMSVICSQSKNTNLR